MPRAVEGGGGGFQGGTGDTLDSWTNSPSVMKVVVIQQTDSTPKRVYLLYVNCKSVKLIFVALEIEFKSSHLLGKLEPHLKPTKFTFKRRI